MLSNGKEGGSVSEEQLWEGSMGDICPSWRCWTISSSGMAHRESGILWVSHSPLPTMMPLRSLWNLIPHINGKLNQMTFQQCNAYKDSLIPTSPKGEVVPLWGGEIPPCWGLYITKINVNNPFLLRETLWDSFCSLLKKHQPYPLCHKAEGGWSLNLTSTKSQTAPLGSTFGEEANHASTC